MTEEISTSTSVDVLIERLKTHPDEFYNRAAVSSYDGEKVFSGVKWRRVIVTLMTDTPSTAGDNLWLNLFSDDEKQRFRDAMYATLRGELDGQVMRAMVTGHALDYDADKEQMMAQNALSKAQLQAQKAAMMQAYQNQQLMGIANQQNSLGNLTVGYGNALGTQGVSSGGTSGLLGSLKEYLKEWESK